MRGSLSVVAAMLLSGLQAADWQVTVIAGTGRAGWSGDGGPAVQAQINDPYGIVRGPDGALWFCEHAGHRIRRIDREGVITTIAGTGTAGYSGDGGPAAAATFHLPHELRFGPDGHLYIVDTGNQVIRRIDLATGLITTVAGTNRRGYQGDGGPASQATFNGPHSLQFGPDGSLYVCDVGNHVIRRINTHGVIETIAGTGRPGPTPDGARFASTPLHSPRSLDFDRQGDLWLVTREGNQVFRLSLPTGRIHHMAGSGEAGFAGNGGPAREAQLNGPKGIALDAEGNAWLADTESHSIRLVEAATGTLRLIAGTGEVGDGSDGDPLACAMNRPHGVFVDADGSVYIGDSEAHRIRVLRRSR